MAKIFVPYGIRSLTKADPTQPSSLAVPKPQYAKPADWSGFDTKTPGYAQEQAGLGSRAVNASTLKSNAPYKIPMWNKLDWIEPKATEPPSSVSTKHGTVSPANLINIIREFQFHPNILNHPESAAAVDYARKFPEDTSTLLNVHNHLAHLVENARSHYPDNYIDESNEEKPVGDAPGPSALVPVEKGMKFPPTGFPIDSWDAAEVNDNHFTNEENIADAVHRNAQPVNLKQTYSYKEAPAAVSTALNGPKHNFKDVLDDSQPHTHPEQKEYQDAAWFDMNRPQLGASKPKGAVAGLRDRAAARAKQAGRPVPPFAQP